jgi:DNA topoisomerase-3
VGGPNDSGADADADRDAPKPRSDEDDPRLPALAEGQLLDGRFDALARQTRPPPRHTEASLLGAMESAGREIEDETLRVAMKDAGLGTPATRAATIETLIKRGFIARQGKQIVATETGIDLIERLPVPTLSSPELTGAWESRLARIARGQDTRAAFMTDIARYVREVTAAIARYRQDAPAAAPVATASPSASPTRPTEGPAGLPCPRCHLGALIVGRRGWGCSRWKEGCPFVVWFEIAGKRLTPAQLRDLVARGKTRPARWKPDGQPPQSGRLVLDLTATREAGAARFLPS